MPHTARYQVQNAPIPLRELPGAALRSALREGYGAAELRRDAMAGLVVGVVALPLSMALAVAVGVAPQHGIYTAIVAGFVAAALGGSRTQVTGPTAAFIVVLAPIHAKFGLAGLLISGIMGGLMLIAMGAMRFGQLIQFIPHPVTTGFTAGIATVIATLQIKDLLGLRLASNPDHFFERIAAMFGARGSASLAELLVGAGTLYLLFEVPKRTKRVPAPLVALPVAALAAAVVNHVSAGAVTTIAARFHTTMGGLVVDGIPRLPPLPMLPWLAGGPDGQPFSLTFSAIRALASGAFAVAMLGAIESLLSAVVADGMARTKHDPDAELIAQGVGNVIGPFFGGIPATGAIARTATNIRSGARSPVAAMVHSVTMLVAVLILAPLIGYLPMTAMAALLLLVAWNMSEVKHFIHIVKVAPRSDVAVLLICYGLTVVFDMVVAVSVGVVLAALLFMRRMAEVTQARLTDPESLTLPRAVPAGVVVYDIAGPLFFGAAQKAMGALSTVDGKARAVVLRMEQVPAMDATGLVALESALDDLGKQGCLTVISGAQPQPSQVLHDAGIDARPGRVMLCREIDAALTAAEHFVATAPPLERRSATRSAVGV